MNDDSPAVFIFFGVIFAIVIGFNIWAAFFAPCDAVRWLPAKDVPARCLLP